MSYADLPEETDAAKILSALDDLNGMLKKVNTRLNSHAQGINGIGEQVNWLTDNVKNIFAMFNSPMFMQQMGSLMGGMGNARPDANTDS
jgi:hypothetical protein